MYILNIIFSLNNCRVFQTMPAHVKCNFVNGWLRWLKVVHKNLLEWTGIDMLQLLKMIKSNWHGNNRKWWRGYINFLIYNRRPFLPTGTGTTALQMLIILRKPYGCSFDSNLIFVNYHYVPLIQNIVVGSRQWVQHPFFSKYVTYSQSVSPSNSNVLRHLAVQLALFLGSVERARSIGRTLVRNVINIMSLF